MRLRKLIIAAGLLLTTSALAPAQDQGGAPHFVEVPGSMEFSGRVIARPLQAATLAARGANAAEIAATRRAAQATLAQYRLRAYEALVDHHVLDVPTGASENQVAARLMATGLFEFVEPDWTLYPIGTPDDTYIGVQWHHDASHMDSVGAWDLHTGTNAVTVGICDTGVETTHPDFALHRVEGYNAVDRVWESAGGNIGPVHWHGTGTTGCAAANGDNGVGVAGVGWNLGHRMMRVSNLSTGSASLSTLTHAALTSIQAGDRVANVSYSGVNTASVRSTATQIKSLGGLLTWSAGNDGANLDWGDRDADDVIVVGATTSSDTKAGFSAYGRSVDLVAPGDSVATTYTGGSYAYVSGTSFSAPLTAGLVGLIWSYQPSLTPDEVEAILKGSCDDLGTGGVDDTYGHGRINAHEALVLAGGTVANPRPTVTISAPSNGTTVTFGTSITFTASAGDEVDGDISTTIEWSSNLAGALGTGASISATLSVGTHTVTASATDSGDATGSDVVVVTVEPDLGTPPAAPSNLGAANGQNGTAVLTWSDNSTDEDDFEILREKQHKSGRWQSTTSLLAGAGATTLTDSSGTGTFRYSIRARNAAGSSAFTGWVEVTVTDGAGGGGGGGGGGKGRKK